MTRLRRALAAVLVAGALPVAAASADVLGPDESIARAFGPLVAGTLYGGSFSSATDVDYLAFEVTKPGQTLHFDVVNTVHGCASANLTGCPLYATLIDGAGLQLGGEGSSAGTGPVSEYAPSDVIDWTFGAAGRYYLAVDSDGDQPTYSLRYDVVNLALGPSAGGGGAGPGSPGGGSTPGGQARGRPIASLRVSPRQRGAVVRARLDIGRALRGLTVRLEQPGAKPGAPAVAVLRLGAVAPGGRTVTLRLDAGARSGLARRGRLALRLRAVAVPVVGATQTVRRSLHLLRG